MDFSFPAEYVPWFFHPHFLKDKAADTALYVHMAAMLLPSFGFLSSKWLVYENRHWPTLTYETDTQAGGWNVNGTYSPGTNETTNYRNEKSSHAMSYINDYLAVKLISKSVGRYN